MCTVIQIHAKKRKISIINKRKGYIFDVIAHFLMKKGGIKMKMRVFGA